MNSNNAGGRYIRKYSITISVRLGDFSNLGKWLVKSFLNHNLKER